MTPMLWDGAESGPITLILAHGAGAPMDSPFMERVAQDIASHGIRVGRFEFPYMAARREGRRPGPDREPVLLDAWREVIAALSPGTTFAVGGKSMGGRMASMIADEVGAAALVCFGYPFHPPGQQAKTRTAHLAALRTPALILQGTRDPFGTKADVATYMLSPAIRVHWLPDGDHDFKPRATSGRTHAGNIHDGIEAAAAFVLGQVR